jgi:flagellar basal body-associated protein FliL
MAGVMAKKKEQEEPADGEGKPAKKGLLKNRKLLLIAGVVLILCLGGGAAGYMFFGKSKSGGDETVHEQAGPEKAAADGEHAQEGEDKGSVEKAAEGEKGGHGEAAEGEKKEIPNVFETVYILPTLEIPFEVQGKEKTFKVDIRIEMDRPELAVEFNDRKEMIQGAVRSVLAGKTLAELEGAEAKIRLKMALIAELNRRLETGKVRNIYFTDFLIM